MEVLVTGGAGFIGSNIVDGLIEAGHQVIVVDNLSTGKKENLNDQAEFYNLDLGDQELKEVFRENEISHVIHHAAQIDVQHSIQDPLSDAQNNILGTINLLESCRAYNVKKIIYASSAAVYGEPDYLPVDEDHPIKAMSPYGISKHTPEHYIKIYNDLYNLKYTIFRYANVYGPRQDPKGEGGVVSIFVDKMLAEERPVIFGDGQQTRDFVHVYDIVKANLLALDNGDNILVNISTQSRDSVNDLVDHLNDILPYNVEAIYKEARQGDIRHSSLANQKAEELLGWTPDYDFKTGLEQTVGYYSK
ncbi:UDP-glucose 4-epimerase [Halanaerobium congolense]|uniref:UDP-glucose 4-epimerase n=1 Tax=Halanaerobium congolense TaxID=54121 RepID=A0A1H9ZV44_9FIRM|nr:SDR family oxidoreductase [Halanaerobium congolense]PTX16414.1 UDP-glucose 4-epimerase [Halanaerobium congolense]SDF18483.1 UDP-glucose 4-epimerase [Halanaerobium congolense]SES85235.1 UDP-glucose 4-epimerase [Halanaerobium congolense]SFO94524.1 UDP-glucose 4-epimerase [Halanaerobium congolense]